MPPLIPDKCCKGMKSETSIYPAFKFIPETIGTGSSEDTRITMLANETLGAEREKGSKEHLAEQD